MTSSSGVSLRFPEWIRLQSLETSVISKAADQVRAGLPGPRPGVSSNTKKGELPVMVGQGFAPYLHLRRVSNNQTSRQTHTHDVRTKNIVTVSVPTIEGVIGMANFGPGATLFTVGRGYTVQQYDINPSGTPAMVASVHHVLSNLPPSPPNSVEEQKEADPQRISGVSGASMPVFLEPTASSEDEKKQSSPLARIAQEQDPLDMEELRDQVPPLASPVSSKSSSVSTRSSGRRSGRSRVGERHKKQPSLYSNQSATRSETTVFSGLSSVRSGSHISGKESVSTRSVSSATSSRHGSSRLRHQVMRSPEEAKSITMVDLFPFTKARLSEVPFTSPRYEGLSVDDLRLQMLSIVFGWDGDIDELIRDERKWSSISSFLS